MKQRICSKCGRTVPDDGTSGKKYVCPQCDGMKRSDLREQERKTERYLAAKWRKKVSA
jgi:predicted RNA-binding Zn-ribbon protein involved in translation (DUF1610 family)